MFDFFNYLWDWLTGGVYDLLVNFLALCLEWGTAQWFRGKLFMLELSWNVAQQVLVDLDFTSQIDSAISSVPSEARSLIYYLQLPEAVNMIISAGVTKWILRITGW